MYYTVSGTISSINIGLKGNTGSTYDANYTATVQGSQLSAISGNSYKTVFTADSSTGLLPQAIVIKPNPDVNIKTVTTSGRVANGAGGFYAKLTLNTPNGTASTTSQLIAPSVPVYANCTVTAITADKL